MKPAKNPVSDHTVASVASEVPSGRLAPIKKQQPVAMPPKAVIGLRTPR